MNYRWNLLGLCSIFLTATLVGQTRKQVDWKPCKDFTEQFAQQVDKFNAMHKDGFKVNLSCMYSGDPAHRQKPVRKVALTSAEIERLHLLRKNEAAAFKAMAEYERSLFRAHGVQKPRIGDPCFYFVGIVVDTDYITVDPNTIDPYCD
jgi:hypothetical protein